LHRTHGKLEEQRRLQLKIEWLQAVATDC